MKHLISGIKNEALLLSQLNEEDLNREIEKVKKSAEKESLTSLQVKWFSLIQEVAFRKIGLRHFETQLEAGLHLHQGKIVEMKTGEGKTLASTLPIGLNALSKKGTHVVTVNDYLAERDQKFMGKIYKGLGLTVGLIKTNSTLEEKQKSYNADITYVTNSELVFDYLRDNSSVYQENLVQRPFFYCLIDEIDSILIDEARTPLILSTPTTSLNVQKLEIARILANTLEKDFDFEIDEKRREIYLTEIGYFQATNFLDVSSLYDPEDPWILHLLNALKAKYIFELNKDYIVLNNKILIVDEFTGRVMEDRRWSLGIHEAIEIKEGVEVKPATKTKSSITYQHFFKLYPKLAGMTGTAKTAEKEFRDIYGLPVVVLSTFKPMIREDLSDLVYQTELSKWKAIVDISKKCYLLGQPILIGTSNVQKSEFLSDLFKDQNIPHELLNAKPENVSRESEIIAQAGKRYAITIATNMAGRGTDIILGGNPAFEVKQILNEYLLETEDIVENDILENFRRTIYEEYEFNETELEKDISDLPYSLENCKISLRNFYDFLLKEVYSSWEEEHLLVKQLGGLFVLGTERHETRRIDNQLRGRAGRQGDPGKSQFFLSLQDELLKIFGGDSLTRWLDFLVDDIDMPLESNLLTKSLENAQKKVEMYNYDLRKNVFQYDEILSFQRTKLFSLRNNILCANDYEDLFLRYSEFLFLELTNKKLIKNISKTDIDDCFNSYASYSFSSNLRKNEFKDFLKEIWISNDLRFGQTNAYQFGILKTAISVELLNTIDSFWTEHLDRMSYIRETINWRSYGQQNPLVEYRFEAVDSFKLMLQKIRACMLYSFLNESINKSELFLNKVELESESDDLSEVSLNIFESDLD